MSPHCSQLSSALLIICLILSSVTPDWCSVSSNRNICYTDKSIKQLFCISAHPMSFCCNLDGSLQVGGVTAEAVAQMLLLQDTLRQSGASEDEIRQIIDKAA